MKKFISKVLLLLVALFVFDRIAGCVLNKWLENVTTNDLGKDNYICDHCREDILIFGSSRAEYHYNAKMIEDSLNFSTYNCGASGYGVILSYGRLLMISERYHPKLVIMEITPEFDYMSHKSTNKDLGELKRHYERNGIKEIFEKVDPSEKYKMMSYLYRYNSSYARNPLRLLKKIPFNKNAIGVQGFKAEHIEFDSMKVSKKKDKGEFQIDSIKYSYLIQFIENTKNISKLIFVISPYWQLQDSLKFEPARHIADSYKMPFINFSKNPKYLYHNEFFKDGTHLNARGADEFTKDLIIEIKKRNLLCHND